MEEAITIYHSSATLFRHFAAELSGDFQCPQLRIINIGGEPVTWKDVDLFKKHFPDHCVLVNELSCSEVTTFAQFFVNKSTEIGATVPVGYPVEDKEVLILDDQGHPMGVGDTGEIAIRSQFLSPGYWNRPDLSELAFSLDADQLLGRIYRTGDLGRKSADGCLEYFGRKDARVKIRGYRVECYEIELALLDIPSVDQAFVTHRQDERDETQLVAYVVYTKGQDATVNELKHVLAQRLPAYMLPASFVFMDTLPLTPSGKIDRRALPEPETIRPRLGGLYVPPRSPLERSVAELCSEILHVGTIGVDDNLFDLGGNSLLAMQIVSRVTRTFQVDMSLPRFYQSPTIASISAVITEMREEASEGSRGSENSQAVEIPLSYFQERLWFLAQWDDAGPTYNICQAYRLKGPFNVWALEESFNEIIKRHDSLRTSFDAHVGQPFQIVVPDLRLRIEIRDLRTVPEEGRDEAHAALVKEEARRTFDLTRSPLLRVLLLRLADDEQLLILTVHQLVCDGWSVQILFSECWACYNAFCRGDLPSLPKLDAQYSDFAIWQRHALIEDRIQPQIAFWQENLKGVLPVLALPTDFPRPSLESFRGARIDFVLPRSLTQALNSVSSQEEVTLFITLLAAFKILLFRYSGQEDSIVAFPISNRSWGATSELIGFFVNTLVARTAILSGLAFKEFLLRVREACYAAYAHQDLPFEKLVEVLRPTRDANRNPLFQAMFIFQTQPPLRSIPEQLSVTQIMIDNGTSKVDLTLSLTDTGDQLTGYFEYSTDLFEASTVERMAGHFRMLLESIAADQNRPISSLPLLTDLERHQLLDEWNDTAADYPKDKCIHRLFEEQVERTPDAIAVEFEESRITYRDLNQRANQLAHYLMVLGIGPEKLVGICIERSLEMVVGLLGILKAGAAYVPLDPAYPKERLEFMLHDAQVSAVLTQENLLSRTQSSKLGSQCLQVCLDRDWAVIAEQSDHNPEISGRLRESGLRDLHVRLHRATERRSSIAPLGG